MQLNNTFLLAQVEELAIILSAWTEQLVIGGGVALVLYDLILSQTNAGAVGTYDIDYLIPRRPIKPSGADISSILMKHGFDLINKSLDQPPVQSYSRQIDEIEIELEFLTDNKSRDKNDVVVIKNAGINAQALSYIEMSLKEATPLILPSGNKIMVVKPEAWVFHKGLTFVKRTSQLKKIKDLYGIWFVLTQLGEMSLATQKALPKLMKKTPSPWKKTFGKNIKIWIDAASPRDWQMLELQDSSGKLKRNEFTYCLENLISHL